MWEKSDAHIAAHQASRNQSKPDFILHMEVSHYEVKSIRKRGVTVMDPLWSYKAQLL
ncbi:Heme-degrading monooxygenase HmoA [Anoxybacillus sp. P3H1B]|uniref:hypothetical protein n=1 Tax=Anoxybacillaceae TaxID=3120669 RepID=UPI000796A62D|nr:Heme-degrading monooxygenase HmoA [Anoxybacillus sp. P3H1B]